MIHPLPQPGPPPEAIAIVGMAVRHPHVDSLAGFWDSLIHARPARATSLAERWAQLAGHSPMPEALRAASICLLEESEINSARYHIPPVQARGLAHLQLLLLTLADEALHDAGWPATGQPARTDVICGTCFGFDRTFANARRVEAARVIERYVDAQAGIDRVALRRALRRHLNRHLKASAYDRVGEMASTIPSRVSMHFKLQGRSLAVEAADGTAFAALDTAVGHLRAGRCDAAVVLVGQRIESAAVPAMLARKGYTGRHRAPFSAADGGVMLGEGAGAVVLRRLGDARRSGQRIYAAIEGIGRAQSPRAGLLRYPGVAADRTRAMTRAWAQVPAERARLAFVEGFGSGLPAEQAIERAGLTAAFGQRDTPLPLGCVKALLGHTFAYSGLAGLIKCALGLHHGHLPAEPTASPRSAGDAPPLTGATIRTDLGPGARVGLDGATVTGSSWHVVLRAAGDPPEIQPASGRIEAMPERGPIPIAVVAAEGRFAQADDAATYWRNSAAARPLIGPLPAEAFDRAIHHSPTGMDPFGSYTDVGASMTTPDRPPLGMRIVPRRWLEMDPAQRAILDVAGQLFGGLSAPPTGQGLVAVASNLSLGSERALDTRLTIAAVADALAEADGIDPATLAAALATVQASLPDVSPSSLDGTLASAAAAHIAHQLGLDAVPIAVEAACASSLAAIDLAIGDLRAGRCDYAIAGGVELASNARDMVLCSALGLLSRSRISPFCARADGFSPGDGAALFLLERLDDARAAGRPVMAVIRAVGAASDARSLIAPDVYGQALAMTRAFAEVDFGPEAVQLIETHGTGTALGDQVEVLSTALVYCATRRATPLALSSVKSMIGHTFAAAGAAGVLRTVLALMHRALPPTVGLSHLNPRLSLPALPARLITAPEPWPAPASGPRRAGVSAFGTGGINYHLLLEEAP